LVTAPLIERARKRGTDKQFREWVQRQPSCLSGRWSEWLDDIGEGRCIAAHHRTAANAGTGCKPEYSCLPLTDAEHRLQHGRGSPELGDRDWWDTQVRRYLERWIASR
jgi:hypothetical protein